MHSAGEQNVRFDAHPPVEHADAEAVSHIRCKPEPCAQKSQVFMPFSVVSVSVTWLPDTVYVPRCSSGEVNAKTLHTQLSPFSEHTPGSLVTMAQLEPAASMQLSGVISTASAGPAAARCPFGVRRSTTHEARSHHEGPKRKPHWPTL